jgi:YggT family protein
MAAALATILYYSLKIYMVIIIVRCLLSWVNLGLYNPNVAFLYRITDPLLSFVRRRIPFAAAGAIDLSPIAVVLFLWILQALLRPLMDAGIHLH